MIKLRSFPKNFVLRYHRDNVAVFSAVELLLLLLLVLYADEDTGVRLLMQCC
jgi:hypothetical protein